MPNKSNHRITSQGNGAEKMTIDMTTILFLVNLFIVVIGGFFVRRYITGIDGKLKALEEAASKLGGQISTTNEELTGLVSTVENQAGYLSNLDNAAARQGVVEQIEKRVESFEGRLESFVHNVVYMRREK